MSSRFALLHAWCHQLRALLPAVRKTRVTPLALLSLGILWAGCVALPRVAAALPLPATAASTERRLRRWLANRAVRVTALWRPFIRAALASRAGCHLILSLDPTDLRDVARVYYLGVVAHKRTLPLCWHLLPLRSGWRRDEAAYLARLLRVAAGWLPPGCSVTLVADRGLCDARLIGVCRHLGWHFVLRVSTDARQGPTLRDGRTLWSLVPGEGRHWYGWGELYPRAGWLTLSISSYWRAGESEPWVLLSDLAPGYARVATYRRRAHAEAMYQDCKTRGWQMEATKITDHNRLHRLLLALFVAVWWAQQAGMRVIRCGLRRRYDRAGRRDLSVQRLGRCHLLRLLDAGKCPPLPLRWRQGGWRMTWLW